MIEWLVVQGVALLLKPAWEEAVSTFTKEAGASAGRAASGWLSDWVRRLRGASPSEQGELVREASAHPEETAAVRLVLEKKLRTTLAVGGEGHPPGADGHVLDAYHALFWRLATMAWWANRTIVIEGSLQGPGWLTACYPKGRDPGAADEWAVPNVKHVWWNMGSELSTPGFAAEATFWVRKVPDDAAGRDSLKRACEELSEDRRTPGVDTDAEPIGRWHEVVGIHSRWVALWPDGRTLVAMRKANPVLNIESEFFDPRKVDYPEEWLPLIQISDPVSGLAAMQAGMDAVAANDASFRSAVAAVLSR